MIFVSDQVRLHTCVIRPRGVNDGNRRLIEVKMKGCQVRDWIVGEKDVIFTNFIHDMWEWMLIPMSDISNTMD